MSQMPPPSQPAMPSSAAGNKNLYTILTWALFPPIGSLVFLFVGKDDPDVNNNSANAVLVHGVMLAVYFLLWIISAIVWPLAILATIWGFVWFVVWVIRLI